MINDINETDNKFIQKVMNVIQKVAPIKDRQVKKTLRNGFMAKLYMKLKIVKAYLKGLKNQNYMLSKIFIMQQDTNYRKWFLIKGEYFWKINN